MDGTRYALPLSVVSQVVLQPEPGPRAAGAAVLGVVNLRGRVVTVVDLRCSWICRAPLSPRKLILLAGRRDLALSVTDVEGFETVEKVSSQPRESRAPVRRG